MLETSDMLKIHDQLHFCRWAARYGGIYEDCLAELDDVFKDDPIRGRDNGPVEYNHKENDDLLRFYENASLFTDAMLADKLHYLLGGSFCAKDTFQFILRGHDDEQAEKLGLLSEMKFGGYTEQQLRYALKCLKENMEEEHLKPWWNEWAYHFVLNVFLETGAYSMEVQLALLMDDLYCQVLEKEGRSYWR